MMKKIIIVRISSSVDANIPTHEHTVVDRQTQVRIRTCTSTLSSLSLLSLSTIIVLVVLSLPFVLLL